MSSRVQNEQIELSVLEDVDIWLARDHSKLRVWVMIWDDNDEIWDEWDALFFMIPTYQLFLAFGLIRLFGIDLDLNRICRFSTLYQIFFWLSWFINCEKISRDIQIFYFYSWEIVTTYMLCNPISTNLTLDFLSTMWKWQTPWTPFPISSPGISRLWHDRGSCTCLAR